MRESQAHRKERARAIIDRLLVEFPDAVSELTFTNPVQCLVATILSAQCTDARVNQVTPALFERFPTVQDFAEAPVDELENLIRSTGFFRSKASHIITSCQAIVDRFDGTVPSSMAALVELDGVGRKTANCVLGNAFGQPAVMVDTHVKRLTWRMGLTRHTNPDVIEQDIRSLLPESLWLPGTHALILHGRAVCKARKPRCATCSIRMHCPQIDVRASK
ncbi:endonuclease III [bacterium]|nr:endonuclease III [candidate division CSSED10-310 bacterium]